MEKDLNIHAETHITASKKELKKLRQREQRQKQQHIKNNPNINMAHPNNNSPSAKGWDRLVNPVQDLGRSLLNFLVGGSSTSSAPSSNRQSSSNREEIPIPLDFQDGKKENVDLQRPQQLKSNDNQGTPVVLRRCDNASTASTALLPHQQQKSFQNNTAANTHIHSTHSENLIALAAQDNSAAVQSPPVLIHPNTSSRRKKRKDKVESKPTNLNKSGANNKSGDEGATDVSDQAKSVSAKNENIKITKDQNSELIEDFQPPPLISFNNIIGRLSKPDSEERNILESHNKYQSTLRQDVRKIKDLPDTPKPSFRMVQERLSSSSELYSKNTEAVDNKSITTEPPQNTNADIDPFGINEDKVSSELGQLQTISKSSERENVENYAPIADPSSLNALFNQTTGKDMGDMSEESLSSQQINTSDSISGKIKKDIEIVSNTSVIDNTINRKDTSEVPQTEPDATSSTIKITPLQTSIESHPTVSAMYKDMKSCQNLGSSISFKEAQVHANENDMLPKEVNVGRESVDTSEKLCDNFEQGIVMDQNSLSMVTQEDTSDDTKEFCKIIPCTDNEKKTGDLNLHSNLEQIEVNQKSANSYAEQEDLNINMIEHSDTEVVFTIPQPPPPPPPGYLWPLASSRNDVENNDCKSAKRKKVEMSEKVIPYHNDIEALIQS